MWYILHFKFYMLHFTFYILPQSTSTLPPLYPNFYNYKIFSLILPTFLSIYPQDYRTKISTFHIYLSPPEFIPILPFLFLLLHFFLQLTPKLSQFITISWDARVSNKSPWKYFHDRSGEPKASYYYYYYCRFIWIMIDLVQVILHRSQFII